VTLVIKNISEEKVRLLKSAAARLGITLSQAVEEAIELWLKAHGVIYDELADDLVWARLRSELLKKHKGKYAVIAGGSLVGVYENLEEVSSILKVLKARGVKRAVVVKVGVDEEGWMGEWLGGSLNAWTTRSR